MERGQYDRTLSSSMSGMLRHGNGRPSVAVRADGLAHLGDLSAALDATPDAIMLVVHQSIKKKRTGDEFRFEHAVHQETGIWIRAARGHTMRTIQAQLLRTSPAECLRLDPPPPRPKSRQPARPTRQEAAPEAAHAPGGAAGAALFLPAAPPRGQQPWAQPQQQQPSAQHAPAEVAAEARRQPQAPQQQQHFAQHAPAGAGAIFLAEGALAAEPSPWPSPLPFGSFLRGGEPPPPAECRHAGVGAALAEEAESPPPLPHTPRRAARAVPSLVNELAAQPHGNPWAGQPHAPALAALPLPPAYQLPQSAVAESPPPLPTALQCRTAAEAAKQSPMPLSQLQWPTAGEASAPAAAASATGQRDKKNKQQSQLQGPTPGEASAPAAAASATGQHDKKNKQHRRVEADRPESPERPPRHVEDAVRPESPQRLQQVVHQLSDENLHLRRRICELEAELLLLRPQPQTTQRLERQDC